MFSINYAGIKLLNRCSFVAVVSWGGYLITWKLAILRFAEIFSMRIKKLINRQNGHSSTDICGSVFTQNFQSQGSANILMKL